MCIRDRCYSLAANQQSDTIILVCDGSRLEEFIHVGEKTCSCLLYTSDAADERSSVDLGGRRIIKKKKHIE